MLQSRWGIKGDVYSLMKWQTLTLEAMWLWYAHVSRRTSA